MGMILEEMHISDSVGLMKRESGIDNQLFLMGIKKPEMNSGFWGS